MALPKAVQRQAEEADRIVDVMNGNQTGEPPETNPPNPDPQPAPEPTANVISQEPTPAPQPVPEEKWENRYHTLKGMYDAEVPRLHVQLKEMQTQIQTLMTDKAAAEAQVRQQAQEPTKSLVTEQDKEAFGSDLIDLIERAAESKVATLRNRESDLMDRIKELEGKLGNVSERQVVSDKDRFLMGLSQKVPEWEQLNVDHGFINWLSEVDPVYGLPRQVALNSAYEAFDVSRVAAIFSRYKELVAPPKPAQPKPSLQSQVAPTRSRVSTPPAAASDTASKFWSESEIGQFYDDWRRGFFDNDEAARMEKEITAAIVEGRVR